MFVVDTSEEANLIRGELMRMEFGPMQTVATGGEPRPLVSVTGQTRIRRLSSIKTASGELEAALEAVEARISAVTAIPRSHGESFVAILYPNEEAFFRGHLDVHLKPGTSLPATLHVSYAICICINSTYLYVVRLLWSGRPSGPLSGRPVEVWASELLWYAGLPTSSRIATFLTYLNTVPAEHGGETIFPFGTNLTNLTETLPRRCAELAAKQSSQSVEASQYLDATDLKPRGEGGGPGFAVRPVLGRGLLWRNTHNGEVDWMSQVYIRMPAGALC